MENFNGNALAQKIAKKGKRPDLKALVLKGRFRTSPFCLVQTEPNIDVCQAIYSNFVCLALSFAEGACAKVPKCKGCLGISGKLPSCLFTMKIGECLYSISIYIINYFYYFYLKF